MSPGKERTGIPDLKLEQFLLGELSPEEMGRIERELENEPALRERVEELRRSNLEILERYPAERMTAAIGQRLERPGRAQIKLTRGSRRPVWWPVPALSAAAAIIAVLLILPPWQWFGEQTQVPLETRIKGLEPQILLFRKTESGSEQLENGAVAREHDLILIQYVAAGKSYGAVFSVDGRGTLTRHAPLEGVEPLKLQQEGAVSLEFSYELDDAPKWERFYFVTSDSIFDLDDVVAAARDSSRAAARDSIPLPEHLQQTIFTLEKEASHE